MPYPLSEWRGHIQKVLGEYKVASVAVARLQTQLNADPTTVADETGVREHLALAQANLEGTYIIRMFAAFEAALRSYDRSLFDDADRETKAATMIDQLGSKKRLKVRSQILEGVHRVRRVRNFWAHDSDADPGAMPIDRVRGLLQSYLDRFPKEWD